MDVEITADRENILLGRREIRFRASYQGTTPNRRDVRSKLVAVLNSDKDLTVLDEIKSDFGSNTVTGYVKVYGSGAAMKVEPAYLLKRNFESKKKAEAEAPPVEKPKVEEKPKEEGKEAQETAKPKGEGKKGKKDVKVAQEAAKPKEGG